MQGSFAPREAAHIGIDLCRAVSAVHAAGLLHRDIKAGNAMREEGGRILLMDFGLTHDHGEHHGVGGTPAYMAPEVLAGKPATVGSDIYALGVLLFHLLTGQYPVDGASVDALCTAPSRVRKSLLDVRSDVPKALARVVETAANPDPARRYPTAGQMLSALSEAMGSGSVDLPLAVSQPKPLFRSWMLVPVALGLAFAFPQVRRAMLPRVPGHSPSPKPARVTRRRMIYWSITTSPKPSKPRFRCSRSFPH